MDDLSSELGMSKKTLYQLFANKQTLLETVLQEKFRSVDFDLAEAITGCGKDFLGALQRLLFCVQQHTEELRPAFVRDVRRSAPELFRKMLKRRQEIIQRHFTKLLSAGQQAGLMRRGVPLRVAIEILLGATEAVINPEKVSELNLTPKSAFSAVVSVFLEGMMTPRGRKNLGVALVASSRTCGRLWV